MHASRAGHNQTLLPDGKVLITGGIFNGPSELFDPATNSFTLLPPGSASNRVYGSVTTLANGKVLFAGGIDGGSIPNAAKIFDPSTLSSTPVAATMISPRYGHSAILLPNGKVLICGGQDLSGVSNTGELFDPATEIFSPVASIMTVPRYEHTLTLLSDGRVLVAGGYSGPGGTGYSGTNTADVFDPATESFVPVASPMSAARYEHTATLLPDGKVLLAGGWSGSGPVASVELFDPATGTFRPLANAMTSPRALHTATVLMNGLILIAGGGNDASRNPLNTAELFNPAGGTFTSLAPAVMTSPRRFYAATLLLNSSVLFTGGDISNIPIKAAELFVYPLTITNVPADIVAEATGPEGTIVNFSLPIGIDSTSQDVPVECTPLPDTTFPLGSTTVFCTASDAAGAVATATFNITVSDTIPPMITTPADITVVKQKEAKKIYGQAGAVVVFAVEAVDTVDGTVAAIANPSSGSFFPVGRTTVDVTATDAHGNQATRSFTVRVRKKKRR